MTTSAVNRKKFS